MAKKSQIDKAIADVDEKIKKVQVEWNLQEAKFKLGIETLCACKDVLVAMKRPRPKREVNTPRKVNKTESQVAVQ